MPSDFADDPRASRFLLDHVAPGSSFQRRLRVVNTFERRIDVTLQIHTAEARDSDFVILEDVDTPVERWLTVEPKALSLEPGTEAFATVRVEVPSDAPEGVHLGVVLAATTSEDGQVDVVSRVGLRVYLSVGPGGAPAPNFSIASLTALRTESGAPSVEAAVINTGGQVLDVMGDLHLLDGPGSLAAGPFESVGAATLDVGQSGTVRFLIPNELPSGPWLARVELRSGLLERAAEATIVFPDAPGESAEPVEATEVPLFRDRGFLLPLAVALVILLLILLGLFWWFFVVKRRKDDEDDEGTQKRQAKVGG